MSQPALSPQLLREDSSPDRIDVPSTAPHTSPGVLVEEVEKGTEGSGQGWLLAKLKPKHKQICSMLAQGIPRGTIAAVIDCTPEYITMLGKQPLIIEYIKEMCQTANLQLEAMFEQSVTAIGEVLVNGSGKERMQAARLQMEATKRIGAGGGPPKELVDTTERLARLAERLLYLQGNTARIIETRKNEHGQFQTDTDSHEGLLPVGEGTTTQGYRDGEAPPEGTFDS